MQGCELVEGFRMPLTAFAVQATRRYFFSWLVGDCL